MNEEQEQEKNIALLFKIGFFILLVLLAFFLGVVFHSKFISATWPLDKQATCTMLNATTMQSCDQLWCGIIDCRYNSTLGACICGTPAQNSTQQQINLSNFYNKTEIDLLLSQLRITLNTTNGTINFSVYDYVNRSELISVKNSILDGMENQTRALIQAELPKEYNNYSDNESSSWPWYSFVLIFAVLFGGAFLLFKNSTKTNNSSAVPIRRTFNRLQKPSQNQDSKIKIKEEKVKETEEEQQDEEEEEEL